MGRTKKKKYPPKEELEACLDYRFQDPTLLECALTHASALGKEEESQKEHEHGFQGKSYQRLEFLGDRVLGLAIAGMLIKAFPMAEEGELARRLNALVRRETCSEVAQEFGINRYMRVNQGASSFSARSFLSLQGDVCEAVLGALYLDGGFEAARRFIERAWHKRMLSVRGMPRDPKTQLQEWAQSLGRPAPTYEVQEQKGSDHAPIFTVAVHVQGIAPEVGRGPSKRIAQRCAAEAVLYREGIWKKENGEVEEYA